MVLDKIIKTVVYTLLTKKIFLFFNSYFCLPFLTIYIGFVEDCYP